MQVEELTTNDLQGMNPETTRFFIEGLKVAIDRTGMSHTEFALGITSKSNLSNILRYKVGTSDKMKTALAKKAGLDVAEIVALGQGGSTQTLSDKAQDRPNRTSDFIPGVQAGHINPSDFLSAAATLVGQYQKNDERMRYWHTMFDALPVAALIVKDGLLCYQNVKGRALGNMIGEPICAACVGDGCCGQCRQEAIERGKCDECPCPIAGAMRTGQTLSGKIAFGGVLYNVNVAPISLHGHEYYLVVATEKQ